MRLPPVRRKATLAEITEIMCGNHTLLNAHARRCGFRDWYDMVDARLNEGRYDEQSGTAERADEAYSTTG